MKYSLDALIYAISIGLFLAFVMDSNAAQKPYTVKSYQVNEDSDYVYYSDNLSDGTEKTRKVKKPAPREYPSSVTLVATNDLPVMVEYVYQELYPTGRVVTNYFRHVKTDRERAVIRLPAMPDIVTPEPGKTDALGMAVKRLKKNKTGKPTITDYKSMDKSDRAVSSRVENGQIVYTLESGKEVKQAIVKAYTVKVKSAPVGEFEWPKDAKPADYYGIGDPDKKPESKLPKK